jgi:hypothetical protein
MTPSLWSLLCLDLAVFYHFEKVVLLNTFLFQRQGVVYKSNLSWLPRINHLHCNRKPKEISLLTLNAQHINLHKPSPCTATR